MQSKKTTLHFFIGFNHIVGSTYSLEHNMVKKKIHVEHNNNDTFTLPSDFTQMENYILHNKTKLTEQVISAIEFAIKNNHTFAEVFKFDSTEYVITISEEDYLININNIYNFYLKTEQYELCPRVVKLQSTLSKLSK